MIRAAFLILLFAPPAFGQSFSDDRRSNEPFPPFHVVGNIYYVGVTGVSSFAIITSKGIILLDGGLPETAPLVLENLKKVGLDPKDVKILLNSHAHFDHAGGLAELKKATGAKLYA